MERDRPAVGVVGGTRRKADPGAGLHPGPVEGDGAAGHRGGRSGPAAVYSSWSTTCGSPAAARRAGIQIATTATRSTTPVTPISVGATPARPADSLRSHTRPPRSAPTP